MSDKTEKVKSAQDKWGNKTLDIGFCIVPSILLRAQQRLGLNPTQLVILIQLLDYWWDRKNKPFPSKRELGSRLGLGPRQVQRYLADLENAGFIQREERYISGKGRSSNKYDLSGLVSKLNELSPEFKEASDMKKLVEQRGGDERLKTHSKNPT
jgi:predicted transcriptional regulator